MKKTLLLLLFTAPICAFAQPKIKAGTNISSLRGSTTTKYDSGVGTHTDYSESTKPKFGFYVGLGYQLNFLEKFSITPELIYGQMGAKGDKYAGTIKRSYFHNHLSLPVFFEYKLIDNLKIGVGPQLDYLLKARYENEYANIPENNKYTLNKEGTNTGFYNRINYGLIAGASYDLTDNISIEARYYLGLSNLHKEENLPEVPGLTATSEMKTSAIQIGAAYKF